MKWLKKLFKKEIILKIVDIKKLKKDECIVFKLPFDVTQEQIELFKKRVEDLNKKGKLIFVNTDVEIIKCKKKKILKNVKKTG